MKFVYCANCGTKLNIFRKALPRHQTIIDCVESHECTEEPVMPELPNIGEFKSIPKEKKQKFIEKLNELEPPRSRFSGFGTDDLRDRRVEEPVKGDSSAPSNLLRQFRDISNQIPENDPGDEPNG